MTPRRLTRWEAAALAYLRPAVEAERAAAQADGLGRLLAEAMAARE